MKQFLIIFALVAALVGSTAYASRPQAILGPGTGGGNFRVPYHETSNRLLSKDTTYILTGWYFIDSTYSITIPSGTLIRGDSTSGGTLIVKRGAQIFATGTASKPIIFTSNKPAGTRTPGDWGGVIILGAAPTNKPTTQQIEGGFNTIPGAEAMYGGTDPNDNSGIFRYVRIEFGGIAFAVDNEINGLTFGGVGRGTAMDHVQVSFANDDDFEFFGGTLDAKYLIGWRSLDDTYDSDFGYSGRLQYCYTKRDPNFFDAAAAGSSNGFESDNEASSPYSGTPRTSARVSNMTLVGPQSDTSVSVSSKWGYSAFLRRATEYSIYNSILMGWLNGIMLRDTLTQRAAIDNRLEIRNTSLQSKSANALQVSSSPNTGNIAGFVVRDWFEGNLPYSATGNLGSTGRNVPAIGIPAAVFNLDATNNPVPLSGTEPATAGTAYQGRLAGDAFFDSVSYRGAFDPSLPRDQQWDACWANYDPQNYDPEVEAVVTTSITASWNMVSFPYKETNPTPASIYPRSISSAFAYSGSYTPSATLAHGAGYWLKFPSSEIDWFRGNHNLSDTFAVSSKWNMIGSITVPVPTSSVGSNPLGIVVSNYFSYNGSGYSIATTIEPSKAYWVKTSTSGVLYLQGTPAALPKKSNEAIVVLEQLNAITFSDVLGQSQKLYFGKSIGNNVDINQYDLPPIAPGESFDARFTSQRMVEISSDMKTSGRYTIALHGGVYPVTVALDLRQQSESFEMLEMANGKVVGKHIVSGNAKVTISNNTVEALMITSTGSKTVPSTFALSQNYPNPFNPTTRFSVDVPEVAQVQVSVYDVLGQKVATLLNSITEPGSHAIEWNAQNDRGIAVPSGIYFVRMNSDKFSSVRKIMLMK